MTIDPVSTNIIKLALFIDQKHPGFVSELWLTQSLKTKILSELPLEKDIKKLILATQNLISKLQDERRKSYLSEILESLEFQTTALDNSEISFREFSQKAYGFEIKRVTWQQLQEIELQLKRIEKELGLSRQQVYVEQATTTDTLLPAFEDYITQTKNNLPKFITNFPDQGFNLETVSHEPWSAFNSHIAPFTSKLSINTDVGLTHFDLHHLAYHEAYGGHHSELSHKDKFLLEGRGEHGLVITFSPQTFISEAIAEGIYCIYQDQKNDLKNQMVWNYNRLTFALQNLASHLFLEEKKSKTEIDEVLKEYSISEKTRENIINFSTDQLFSRYAPVYFSAYDFFQSLYQKAANKEELIKTLFTQPCTPSLLLKEFTT